MTIQEIAYKINELSSDYSIGNLQSIRKKIKGLSKKPTSDIFNSQTISEDWAFHVGGRSELQFNIGFEEEGLRYGFAFSLETSQSLPTIDILYPKILKLNNIINDSPELFNGYKMWVWYNGKRSNIYDVKTISEDIIKQGAFIFIGKIVDVDSINIENILNLYDDLLNLYIEIESDSSTELQNELKDSEGTGVNFIFSNARRKLPQSTSYTSVERQISVDARHTLIQEKLIKELIEKYGNSAVGIENNIGGKKIDVVLNLGNDEYIFYEVKTSNSAKSCIRQALGQLMEYSYFNCKRLADKIVVVGEYKADVDTKAYIEFLQKEFSLPIDYKCIN